VKLFTIQPDERFDVTFRLAVFNTRKDMCAAIKESKDTCDPLDDMTMGMFRPMASVIQSGISGECFSKVLGIMFLNLADLSDEVIAHECAHAAFAREFNVRHYIGTFDKEDGHDEQEEFCWFLGKAVEKVTEVIKKNYKPKRGKK